MNDHFPKNPTPVVCSVLFRRNRKHPYPMTDVGVTSGRIKHRQTGWYRGRLQTCALVPEFGRPILYRHIDFSDEGVFHLVINQ